MKIYSHSDFQEILSQIYGDNFISQLTSNENNEDFIKEIEQTLDEIEKLREKDEVIEKEIEEHFKNQKNNTKHFSYSNYEPLNKSQNSFVPKPIIEEKEEFDEEEYIEPNLMNSYSSFHRPQLNLNSEEILKGISKQNENAYEESKKNPSNSINRFMKPTKSNISHHKNAQKEFNKDKFEKGLRNYNNLSSPKSLNEKGRVSNISNGNGNDPKLSYNKKHEFNSSSSSKFETSKLLKKELTQPKLKHRDSKSKLPAVPKYNSGGSSVEMARQRSKELINRIKNN